MLWAIPALALAMLGCRVTVVTDEPPTKAELVPLIVECRAALSGGRPEVALRRLEPLEDAYPSNAEVQMLLGAARLAVAESVAAREQRNPLCAHAARAFDRAAAARPQDAGPWIGRARAAALIGDEPAAATHAARAEELLFVGSAAERAKDLALYHQQRARSELRTGSLTAARHHAEAVLRCHSIAASRGGGRELDFSIARNEALQVLGRGNEALEIMALTLPDDGGSEAWHAELQRCAVAATAPERLLAIYAELARRAPSGMVHERAGRLWLERADSLRLRGERKDARAAYHRAAEEFARCAELAPTRSRFAASERARALGGAGWAALELEEPEEAAEAFLEALKIDGAMAAVPDVLDRSVVAGLDALASKWARGGDEARACELLVAALREDSLRRERRSRWLEHVARWSRDLGIAAQRSGSCEKAREHFERSRESFARAADLETDSRGTSALALRCEAAVMALYHLAPQLPASERAASIAGAESELRAVAGDLERSASTGTVERELAADVHQHLGHLLLEHRDSPEQARVEFEACLKAAPERSLSPQLRWYLERIASSPKESHR